MSKKITIVAADVDYILVGTSSFLVVYKDKSSVDIPYSSKTVMAMLNAPDIRFVEMDT